MIRKINKLNKRGGHVGIVLSFVIFVTFLVFLYTITEPAIRVERGKQDLLRFLQVELINNFTGDMTKAIIDISENGDCIKISTSELDSSLIGLGVVGKDVDENIIDTYVDDGNTYVGWREGLLELYYSKEFSKGENLGSCNSRNYNIELVRTTEEIFESKIIKLVEFINTSKENYESVKEILNVPIDDEFGFSFENGTRDIIAETQEEEITTNIFVEEIPIQYIDDQANKKPGFLKIKVW